MLAAICDATSHAPSTPSAHPASFLPLPFPLPRPPPQALSQYAQLPPSHPDATELTLTPFDPTDPGPALAAAPPGINLPPVSKTKKHIVQAIIEGNKCVQIESRGEFTEGVGQADHFV